MHGMTFVIVCYTDSLILRDLSSRIPAGFQVKNVIFA